jgi:hypothetical protein
VDEVQSCIAVEGEMTLAEYLQMANSGIVVMQDSDGLDNRIIDEDIEIERTEKFEEAEDDDDDDDEDDDRSIATSLFVEVASVDGKGSYFGYGGSSGSDDEVEEYYDQDQVIVPMDYGDSFSRQASNSPQTSEKSSRHRVHVKSRYKKPTESSSARQSLAQLSGSLASRENSDAEGYDAASETGRGESSPVYFYPGIVTT